MQAATTSTRSSAPRRRVIAAVGVLAVTAVSAVGLGAATAAPTATVGGAAAAFLPPDGTVTWQMTPDGAVAQWEQARIAAGPALFLLPDGLAGSVFGGYPADDPQATAWVSLGDAAASRDGDVARDLHTVTADGIRLVASVGGATDIGFSPGILALPSDVADGSTWTSRGTAVFAAPGGAGGSPSSGTFDYTAELHAHAPSDPRFAPAEQDGCLQVDAHVSFTGDGGSVSSDGADLWCPGRGIVASTADSGATLPASAPAGDSVDAAPTAAAWGDPMSWSADALAVGWDDPVWQDPTFDVAPSLAPAALADGRLAVDDSSDDVAVLRRSGDRLVVDRLLHPGGRLLGLSTAGDLLVVATSDRRLVAYDATGARRWERTLPDLVVAPIVGTSEGLVVGGIDGVLRLLDPSTGADRWATPVSAAGIEHVAVVGGIAVAADQSGGLATVSLADGSVLWQMSADEAFVAVSATGDALVAGTGTLVERLDPATGSTLWTTDASASVTGVAVAGDTVVATTLGGTIGVGLDDGAVRWRIGHETRIVSDGTTAVVEGGGAVAALAADGSAAASWPVPAESLGAARSLVVGPGGVWLVDSVSGIVEVGG